MTVETLAFQFSKVVLNSCDVFSRLPAGYLKNMFKVPFTMGTYKYGEGKLFKLSICVQFE